LVVKNVAVVSRTARRSFGAIRQKESFGLMKAQPRKTDGQELFARAFAGKFFLDLPEVISQQINFDEEITEWLQLSIGSIANVGGESFNADDYWRAVEKALLDGASTITSQRSAKEYRFVRQRSGNFERGSENEFPRISVVDNEGKPAGEMNDPSLGLLSPDEPARRTTVLRLRGWFDCGPKEFETEAHELIANGDPGIEWRGSMNGVLAHLNSITANSKRVSDGKKT
jgi:hypothetical protein